MQSSIQLDKLDRTILEILLKDARTPYLEIARMCNVSGATVHLRIQKLEKLGIIKGSRLTLDYKKLGLGVCAFLGIYLDKCDSFEEVFTHMEQIPEIVECHYTTGVYAIFLKVHCRDTHHLRDLLIEKIQTIPFVRRTETFISLQQNFEREPSVKDIFRGETPSEETPA
ncbi:Lrp/AsnC ligand binding domain-containing protein [Pontibacter sp. G13]|uniref:Lrp/AsnC ligand binding domain-containing protein n=1 Tax=Pontibacter sp. G13 TaxID=3074898 RepID=UPI00288B2109|nr:Lrp/AsnC ligand binding domain-containing protein [Pontibacter sp. G13]WNJ16545.1 Lrp/AsnC ligand binding domain-containing protein [Pontibacter sp. G13]